MGLLGHSLRTKGLKNFLKRFFTIAARFGLTPGRYTGYLRKFCELQAEFRLKTSFPITASVLERHERALLPFRDSFLFLIHGLRHIDYSRAGRDTARRHIRQAGDIMARFTGSSEHGFRAPYLRYGESIKSALREEGILFDSSRTILVEEAAADILPGDRSIIDSLYSPMPFSQALSLPGYEGDLLEIPVTLPDDEIVVDRLGISDEGPLFDIFRKTSERVFEHEEMFVMQLHPERIFFLFEPLRRLLREMEEKNIWVTDLLSLARWTRDVRLDRFELKDDGKSVSFSCRNGRKLLSPLKEGRSEAGVVSFSGRIPAVFVSERTDDRFADRLALDGFFVLRDSSFSSRCAFGMEDGSPFSASAYRVLLNDLRAHGEGLVRLSRWPEGKHGAFVLSGDIDALTIGDFFVRFLHFTGEK